MILVEVLWKDQHIAGKIIADGLQEPAALRHIIHTVEIKTLEQVRPEHRQAGVAWEAAHKDQRAGALLAHGGSHASAHGSGSGLLRKAETGRSLRCGRWRIPNSPWQQLPFGQIIDGGSYNKHIQRIEFPGAVLNIVKFILVPAFRYIIGSEEKFQIVCSKALAFVRCAGK